MYFRFSDLLYPRRCAICDTVLGRKEEHVCADCRNETDHCTDARCVVCGRFTSGKDNIICSECASFQHVFDQASAPFAYDGKIRDSLLRLKYGKRPEYSAFYSQQIFKGSERLIKTFNAKIITFVPAHASRLRDRGYDQALLIAKGLSGLTGIKLEKKLLKRKKKTRALASQSAEERKASLKGAFELTGVPPKKVILVDDIFTTGATADEISRLLKVGGCREVLVLTAATAHLAR